MAAPEVYTGKDCVVQLDSGEIGLWTKYTIEITVERRAAKPANSKIYKQASIHRHAKITLEGLRGGSETFAAMATADKPVVPSFTDAPPDMTDYTNWRILDCNMSQDENPGTYTMVLEQGMIGTSTRTSGTGPSLPS